MMKRTASLATIGGDRPRSVSSPRPPPQVRVGPNYKLDSDSSPFRARDQIGLAVSRTNPQHVVAVNANYLDLTLRGQRELRRRRDLDRGGAARAAPAGHAPALLRSTSPSSSAPATTSTRSSPPPARTTAFGRTPSVIVYRSTDGGMTWQHGVVAMLGGDRAPTRPRPRRRARATSGRTSRSTPAPERAAPTASTRSLATSSATGNGDVRPRHRAVRRRQQVAVSDDGGQTFAQRTNASRFRRRRLRPGSRPSSTPTAPSRSSGARRASTASCRPRARTNQGQTWSAPVDIAKRQEHGALRRSTTRTSRRSRTRRLRDRRTPRRRRSRAWRPTRRPPGRLYLVYIDTPLRTERPGRRLPAAPTTSSTTTRRSGSSARRTSARRGRRRSGSATPTTFPGAGRSRRAIRTSRSRRAAASTSSGRTAATGTRGRASATARTRTSSARTSASATPTRLLDRRRGHLLRQHPHQRPVAQQRRRL